MSPRNPSPPLPISRRHLHRTWASPPFLGFVSDRDHRRGREVNRGLRVGKRQNKRQPGLVALIVTISLQIVKSVHSAGQVISISSWDLVDGLASEIHELPPLSVANSDRS
jgi:hypothetical protein